jgi:hypothetical protein
MAEACTARAPACRGVKLGPRRERLRRTGLVGEGFQFPLHQTLSRGARIRIFASTANATNCSFNHGADTVGALSVAHGFLIRNMSQSDAPPLR